MLLWINNLPNAPAGGGATTPTRKKRLLTVTGVGG